MERQLVSVTKTRPTSQSAKATKAREEDEEVRVGGGEAVVVFQLSGSHSPTGSLVRGGLRESINCRRFSKIYLFFPLWPHAVYSGTLVRALRYTTNAQCTYVKDFSLKRLSSTLYIRKRSLALLLTGGLFPSPAFFVTWKCNTEITFP